jgi:hypothetical protein
VFVEQSSGVAGQDYYHAAQYEPEIGIYLGAYAETDKSAWGDKLYFDGFADMTGKEHAAYLIYMTYGMNFNAYSSHFSAAKQEGAAMQIALQPLNGINEVQDNDYLRQFARDAANSGIPVFLRFANEMNDPTSPWYIDAEVYKTKYRIVANVFHQEAPNVVMVWAPNYFPPNNIQSYYPGDEYVDWVGVSLYKEYLPSLDPLGQNIDREKYLTNLANIYNLYSDHKPIFISESGVTYTDQKTGQDITNWAMYQMKQFYAYLPMLYPKVKAVYWFDSNHQIPSLGIYRSYSLSANQAILGTYQDCISSDYYLSQVGSKSPICYSDIGTVGISPRTQKISAYITTGEPFISRVIYKIGNETIGTSTSMPWTVSYNFNPYAGQAINLTVEAYGINNTLISSQNVTARVGSANVKLGGELMDLNCPIIIVEDRTFLPVRSLVESSGGTITWNEAAQSFVISKGTDTLELAIGSDVAYKNDRKLSLDAAPFIFNNRSYLPLRFISEELLGLKVDWVGETNTVVLTN